MADEDGPRTRTITGLETEEERGRITRISSRRDGGIEFKGRQERERGLDVRADGGRTETEHRTKEKVV